MKATLQLMRFPFRPARISIVVLVALSLGLVAAIQARADDKPDAPRKGKAKVKSPAKADDTQDVVVTGSLIPQKVKLDRIPVTTFPVTIISYSDIRQSGKATLPGVLRQQLGR